MKMRIMLNITVFAALILLVPGSYALASGLESNGIGARGRTMGNAMVAVADDWTAVFYNPAGLARLEEDQSGFVYELFSGGLRSTSSLRNLSLLSSPDPARGDFIDPIGDEPGTFGKKDIDAVVHYAEYGCAMQKGRAVFGLAIYGSGSGADWQDRITSSGGDSIRARVGFTNGSANIPLALGYRLTDTLSIGGSLTARYGLLKVDISKLRSGSVPYTQKSIQETEGFGLSTDLGIHWQASGELGIGFAARLPFRLSKSGTTRVVDTLGGLAISSGTSVKEDYPLRLAAGAAWRPTSSDLLGITVTWMNWEEYERHTSYDDPVPFVLEDSSGNPGRWENTITAGIGYERKMNEKWTGRLGLLYDQAPEPEEYRTLIGGLVVDSWKLSAGTGIRLGEARLDLGYSYTYGPPVDGYIPGTEYSSRLHEFYVGVDWGM
jgi:long-chain fatty acid transport protein